MMKKKTLYEFLDVSPEATAEEIKIAAQSLAIKFHPSKYPGNNKVKAHFNKIKQVYNALKNPEKRAVYDKNLAKKHEITLYHADINWIGYVITLAITIILWLLILLLNVDKLNYISIICFAMGIIVWLNILLHQFTVKLTITTQNIIAKFALKKQPIEVKHYQFQDIEVKQSKLGKWLNFGTLKIRENTGKVIITISDIFYPQQFKQQIINTIKKYN
ncbi:MAG: DnaJ domain-containing protein [Thiomargarita sp.]|nr:DnaJ domain-containing protein [Thiomargarita sp.]